MTSRTDKKFMFFRHAADLPGLPAGTAGLQLDAANVVRLQLHALAYNLASFFRTLVLPTRSSGGR